MNTTPPSKPKHSTNATQTESAIRAKQEAVAQAMYYYRGGIYPSEYETIVGEKQRPWESLEQWEHSEYRMVAERVLEALDANPLRTYEKCSCGSDFIVHEPGCGTEAAEAGDEEEAREWVIDFRTGHICDGSCQDTIGYTRVREVLPKKGGARG